LLDYLRGQDADLDVGALGGPAQQLERLVGAAPVLGHQDTLGLLDHGHAVQSGPEPGERRLLQSLAPGPAFLDPVNCRLQTRPGLFKPLDLAVAVHPPSLQRIVTRLRLMTWTHDGDATRPARPLTWADRPVPVLSDEADTTTAALLRETLATQLNTGPPVIIQAASQPPGP